MIIERLKPIGIFSAECLDKDGKVKWKDVFPNLVVTVGRNEILNQSLDGAAFTAANYMGLISSVGYASIAAGDIMTNHGGWDEAGPSFAPGYAGDRKTCVWAAAGAGAKALSAALSFAPSENGTLKGSFIVTGAGAVATHDDTNGILLSAGLFTEGDRIVVSGDTVNVSYTITLS